MSVGIELNEVASIFLYLFTIAASCLFAWIYDKRLVGLREANPFSRFLWRLAVTILPTLVFGLRSQYVGWDSAQSFVGFISMQHVGLATMLADSRGPAFTLLEYVLGCVSGWNITFALLVIHGLSLYLIVCGLEKFRPEVSIAFGLFSYLCFCGFFAMDQMRQLFAMSVWFVAVPYVFDRKPKQYFAVTFLAATFHVVAVLGFLFYFFVIHFKRCNQVLTLGVVVACVLLALSAPILFEIMGSFVGSIDYYSSYFEGRYVTSTQEYEGTGFGFVISLLPFAFPLIFYRRYIPDNMVSFFVICFMISVPLRMLGYQSAFLARMYLLPSLPLVFLYPLIYRQLGQELVERKVYLFTSIGLLLAFFVYYALTSHGIIPYSTVLLAG